MIIKILFWISTFLILHTYVIYPLLLLFLDKLFKKSNKKRIDNYTPFVSVLMPVHNEEMVIREKIEKLFSSDYPADRIELRVGSDSSDDRTNDILEDLKVKYPALHVIHFRERTGKPAVINRLLFEAKGEILIITDANVFPDKNSIRLLINNFSDKTIGLVDSRLVKTGTKKDGISLPELAYLSIEMKLKEIEGRLWGTMMGPSGGFYAVRKESFEPLTQNTLADDFRICMNVIRKGEKTIGDHEVLVYEDATSDLSEEFLRKVRISAGNFQNMKHFTFLLLRPFSLWAFSFISHKLLRWITPFLWLITVMTNILLINHSLFFLLLIILQVICLFLPPFDMLLQKFKINLVPLRFFTHFYFMNIALFVGFIKYIQGIKSGVWTPTKRHY